MGISKATYEALFEPRTFFEQTLSQEEEQGQRLLLACCIVALCSGLAVLYTGTSADWVIFNALFSGTAGLVFWLIVTLIFAGGSFVFTGTAHLQRLFVSTAFSLLPWLFFPMVMLFKNFLGVGGNILVIVSTLALWVWTTVLYFWALKSTFSLSLERLLLLVWLPFLMGFLSLAWIFGFFANLIHLFIN